MFFSTPSRYVSPFHRFTVCVQESLYHKTGEEVLRAEGEFWCPCERELEMK